MRFGLLGCADVAWRRTLPALATVRDARLVAVASRSRQKACRFAAAFGAEAVDGYDELLARPDVDAVYVPLPNGLHAAWVERALQSGKHVLVEKPLTTSASETMRMFAVAQAHGRVLTENMMFAHHAQHAVVQKMMARGDIGRLRCLEAAFTVPPRAPGDIRLRADLGGGALLDQGVYPVRAALLYLGADLDVATAELRIDRRSGVDLEGRAVLSAGNGASATLTFGMAGPYRSHCALLGAAGRIVMKQPFTLPGDQPARLLLSRGDRPQSIEVAPDDQFSNALRSFCASVRSGGTDLAPQEVSTRQSLIVDAIRDAARRHVD